MEQHLQIYLRFDINQLINQLVIGRSSPANAVNRRFKKHFTSGSLGRRRYLDISKLPVPLLTSPSWCLFWFDIGERGVLSMFLLIFLESRGSRNSGLFWSKLELVCQLLLKYVLSDNRSDRIERANEPDQGWRWSNSRSLVHFRHCFEGYIYIVYPSLESECNVETGELIATFDISNQFRRGKGCSNMEVKLQKWRSC